MTFAHDSPFQSRQIVSSCPSAVQVEISPSRLMEHVGTHVARRSFPYRQVMNKYLKRKYRELKMYVKNGWWGYTRSAPRSGRQDAVALDALRRVPAEHSVIECARWRWILVLAEYVVYVVCGDRQREVIHPLSRLSMLWCMTFVVEVQWRAKRHSRWRPTTPKHHYFYTKVGTFQRRERSCRNIHPKQFSVILTLGADTHGYPPNHHVGRRPSGLIDTAHLLL